MHFLIISYSACTSLAKWRILFLGTSHFKLEEGRCIPRWNLWGAHSHTLQLPFRSLGSFVVSTSPQFIRLNKRVQTIDSGGNVIE